MHDTTADGRHDTLVALLNELDDLGYSFTAITPSSHARVLARREGESAQDLRDVFGWSMPFERQVMPDAVWRLMDEAGLLTRDGDAWQSRVRVSELGGHLFLHSAFPTTAEDAVFFGPDSYRFVRFLSQAMDGREVRQLVDLGAGCGPGGISAPALVDTAQLTLVDRNPLANAYAAANAEAAGVEARIVQADRLDAVDGPIDCIIANPPFIIDRSGRAYRDGGEALGTEVALRWAAQAMARLEPGGTMLLYTGTPIVGGEDPLLDELASRADETGFSLRYEELDPDIFGEELDTGSYAEAAVERIAAVGAVLTRD